MSKIAYCISAYELQKSKTALEKSKTADSQDHNLQGAMNMDKIVT